MKKEEKLELFGKELMNVLRDGSIDEYLMIKNGDLKSTDAQNIFKIYSSIDKKTQGDIDTIVFNVIDRVVHNLLWMFEESEIFTIAMKDAIDPTKDIVEMSDGLSGELYTDEGWIENYSKFSPGTIS